MADPENACYRFRDIDLNEPRVYRLSAVSRMLDEPSPTPDADRELFELGSGNVSVAWNLTRRSLHLARMDLDADGIDKASRERTN
jgi:2-polyprenyl-6-hydroxyphenyl methylase/3-demethylubiquinone-9 3-methyltransferase